MCSDQGHFLGRARRGEEVLGAVPSVVLVRDESAFHLPQPLETLGVTVLFRGQRAKLLFVVLVGSFPDCVECVRRSMAPEA